MAAADPRGDAWPEETVLSVEGVEGLAALATVLAATLPERAFLALEGDLGAGKTTFVKALAAAAGIDPTDVTSPTFGLVHAHDLPPGLPAPCLVHVDAYRLAGPADLGELGWDELLAAPGWLAVEWPSRIAAALPSDRLDILIDTVSPTGRRILFLPRGERYRPAAEALRALATRSP